MSKPVKILGGLALCYLLLMGGSGIAIRMLLSSSVGRQVREQLQERLPVEVSISDGAFDIGQWMLFRPAISFDDLVVRNPPGFSDEPLLEAAKVSARADLRSLFSGALLVGALEILSPTARIETGSQGKTNVDVLLEAFGASDAASEAEPADGAGAPSVTIDSFRITDGRLLYYQAGGEPMLAKNLELDVAHFTPDSAFPLTARLDLFEQEAIRLAFDGVTGPFSARSSPTEGRLTIDARPGLLPESFRRQYLGTFLAEPGSSSEVHIESDLQGDVLGLLTGAGEITIDDLLLGEPDQGQLPLSGSASMLLTLVDPLADPTYQIVMPDADLQLGAGRWQGGLDVQYDGSRVRGESRGAIAGVDVNQMLSSLTTADDVLFGDLAIPRYAVTFSGRTAQELLASLSGAGRLDVADGKLAIFDVLGTIEQHLGKLKGGDQPASGATSFIRFGSDLELRDQRLYMPNLQLESDSARIGGSGSMGFDQSLRFDLSSLVSGALAQTLGGSTNADGIAQVAVPLQIRGALDDPKIRPDLGRIAQKAAVDKARGVLDSLFNRGEGEPGSRESGTEEAGGQPASPDQAPDAADARPRLPLDLGGLFKKRK